MPNKPLTLDSAAQSAGVIPGDPAYAFLEEMRVILKTAQGLARRQQPCRAPIDRRFLFVGPVVVLVALVAGIGIGWWMHDNQGILAGQTECVAVGTGVLCKIPIWQKVPSRS